MTSLVKKRHLLVNFQQSMSRGKNRQKMTKNAIFACFAIANVCKDNAVREKQKIAHYLQKFVKLKYSWTWFHEICSVKLLCDFWKVIWRVFFKFFIFARSELTGICKKCWAFYVNKPHFFTFSQVDAAMERDYT